VQNHSRLSFVRPPIKVFHSQRFDYGFLDHYDHPLMMNAFTDTFQFFVFADFVGALALRKLFADSGK
jgi:hypothetical protein